jgi:hypothetical protein
MGKMNQELKNKWIEALRSGKYKQGRNYLRMGDSFCCLGVLCDVDDPSKWRANHFVSARMYGDNLSCLPDYFPLSPRARASLMRMNDVQNKSFEEIADWIEENV